ncbi:hydroxymethylglutaryl-CoA lyase [Chelatococcus sp. GCM10030263]|uniref:hydroxymethylglutaryl-CoA lyase n=1 Tax=Chelatococcus sp. GCM10030263 TaxID=3273387 RepID=UPI00360FEDAC
MKLVDKVHIMEVGPRDGFQSERKWIPTETKIEIVNALSRTGVPTIQVTSFTHPKAIPQLADAEEMMRGIDIVEGVSYRALTPNMRGLQRALAFKDRLDGVSVMLSVTESHNRANGNRSIADTFAEIEAMAPVAQEAGFIVSGSVICAFGCPFEGEVPLSQLERVAERYLALGITHMSLADTIGVANPLQIYRVASHMRANYPAVTWTLHLHNTRDMALANVLAGMQAGIDRFDGGVAGLGGCPYAPGASGNIATEDLVNMLQEMGIETGVDLDKVLAIARRHEAFIDHPLDSALLRAGKRSDLKPAPQAQQKVAVLEAGG